MRILLFTQWWQPELSYKGLPFAQGLRSRGYEVEVLTGFPNYPDGRLYPGYRVRPWQKETMAGVPVLRTALYPSHDASGIKRAANYLSFACSSFFLSPLLLKKPDLIYVYNLVTLGPTALLLKKIFRCPVVYDIQDIWPDSVFASGLIPGTRGFRILNRWCSFLYRHIDKIVVLSPGYKALLMERGVPEDKIDVIYNWDPGENDPDVEQEIPYHLDPQAFNVVYSGNIGKAQHLDTVLHAADILKSQAPGVRFTFIGNGVDAERLKKETADRRLPNVTFYPQIPQAQLRIFLRAADALLVHLKDDPIFRRAIPSKTQTYLAAGKPILMGVRGDAEDLIKRSGAGLAFRPEDASALVESVKTLAGLPPEERARWGKNGRDYYQAHLSFTAALRNYARVFDSLARPGRRRTGADGKGKK